MLDLESRTYFAGYLAPVVPLAVGCKRSFDFRKIRFRRAISLDYRYINLDGSEVRFEFGNARLHAPIMRRTTSTVNRMRLALNAWIIFHVGFSAQPLKPSLRNRGASDVAMKAPAKLKGHAETQLEM